MTSVGTPVFICGHPKSGTTLLAALLDGHSQLLVFPEETFYLQMLAAHKGLPVETGAEWLLRESACGNLGQGTVDSVLDGDRDYSDVDFDQMMALFQARVGEGPQTHAHVLESVIAAYGDVTGQCGKGYWVEKTPGNERDLSTLTTWYPDMRALYVVRDPRDVYTSYARKKEIESGGCVSLPVENFVCRWGLSVWAWQCFSARRAGGMVVRYEDLLRYPEQTMARVCSFLGVDHEDALQSPTKNGKLWRGNSMHGDRFSAISTRPIGRWREGLPQETLVLIETYLGKAMAWFGYQRATEAPPLSRAAASWCRGRRKKRILGMLMRLYYPFGLPRRLRD